MAPWVKSTYIQGPPRDIGPTLMHSHSLLFKWIYPHTRAFRVIIAVLTGNIQTASASMIFYVFECLMVQINTHIQGKIIVFYRVTCICHCATLKCKTLHFLGEKRANFDFGMIYVDDVAGCRGFKPNYPFYMQKKKIFCLNKVAAKLRGKLILGC